MKNFVYNENLNVNVLKDYIDLPYSDGSVSESKLLEILKKVNDKGTFSEELPQHVTNWVEEYHFSKKRHLAIKHLNIKKGDRVLELGSGCGAITRYLAEIGAEVTSVEGALARALVNGERCKGFSNVDIYVDNILNFDIDDKFDWVLLIGVLEYSTKFIKTKKSELQYISKAKNFLNDDGNLIIAIENKLGIKYLNGAEEDHNGRRYYGIENLYGGDDVTTWGYDELKSILKNSGFTDVAFYGAFPDYKLPQVIFTELIDDSDLFRSEELLHYIKSHDYSKLSKRNFEESFFAKALRLNNYLFKFSNSFIIHCKKSKKFTQENLLAKYYSITRRFDLCVETSFIKLNDSSILVKKNRFSNDLQQVQIPLKIKDEKLVSITQRIVENSVYKKGIHLGYLFSIEHKRQSISGVECVLDGWAKYLSANFKFYDKENKLIQMENLKMHNIFDIYIDGQAIDCGLHNLIIDLDEIHSFDLEWISDKPVSFLWVICRNISIAMRYGHGVFEKMQFKDVCDYFFSAFDLCVTDNDLKIFYEIEKNFGEKISRNERSDLISIF
jgi:SAM-dependent methyltransferase